MGGVCAVLLYGHPGHASDSEREPGSSNPGRSDTDRPGVLGPRFRGDDGRVLLPRMHSLIHISNSQFQTAKVFQANMRHHPCCLARPRVGPSSRCLPSKMRGMARQGAQPLFFVCPHSLSEIRGAARRATQTSLRSLGLLAASSLLRRAALFVAVHSVTASVSQLLAGGPYWPPGGAPALPGCVPCEGTPAGAASDPTPHDAS